MAEKYFYSANNKGFYLESGRDLFEGSPLGWPEDAVEITASEYSDLFIGQANGKIIVPDENGYPVLTNPPSLPPPSQEQRVAIAEQQRQALRSEADAEIARRQDAVEAGIATADEASELTDWKKYRVLLMRIDTTKAPNIDWPPKPGAQAN